MKATDITIVHLSDLHFNAKRESMYVGLLLADIQHQIRHSSKLMIVVTGDFAVRGEVSQVSESLLNFFKQLKSMIPQKCELLAVEVVPGNHDLIRPKVSNGFNDGTYKNRLLEFDELSRKIQDVFKDKLEGKNTRDAERVGVTYVPYNDQEIALVRLDTSGADIEAHMLKDVKDDIAEAKREKSRYKKELKGLLSAKKICELRMKEVYKDIKDQGDIIQNSFILHDSECKTKRLLSIVLAHHPLTWIKESGVDKVHDTLFKRGLGYTDLWLCGHMHMSQLYYTSENNHQKIMLMSGIGRQDSQHTCMRYSIYNISLERNVCAVQSRGATDGSPFAEDHAMGRSLSKGVEHLTIPLRSNQIGAVIRLNNSGQNRAVKDYYVDDTVLDLLREIRERIEWFKRNISIKIEESQQYLVQCLLSKKSSSAKKAACLYIDWRLLGQRNPFDARTKQVVLGILTKEDLVKHFLTQICIDLYQCITRPIERFECESVSPIYRQKVQWDDIQWRFHFRKYANLSKDGQSPCSESDKYIVYVSNRENSSIQEVDWGGFIKNAFNHREKCLIQSANQGQNPIVTDWDDFLTSIPRFRNSIVERKNCRGRYEARPILSFGASIMCRTQESLVLASLILYAFEFLDVNRTIGDLIESFLDSILLDDIRSFLV